MECPASPCRTWEEFALPPTCQTQPNKEKLQQPFLAEIHYCLLWVKIQTSFSLKTLMLDVGFHLTFSRQGRCCPSLLQPILQQVPLQHCNSCIQKPNGVSFPISQSLVNISRDLSSNMADLTRHATATTAFFSLSF